MTSLTVRLNPRHVFAGYACWQRFSKRDHHPIAAHFRRRLPRRQTVSAPALAVGSGIIILLAMAFAFHSIAEALVWTIPLWLMLHSFICSAAWIHRIVAMISRQSRAGVLDGISVIPPGPLFVYEVICKVVLHRNDDLAWLTAMRKFMALLLCISMLFPILVAASLTEEVNLFRLAVMLVEIALLATLVYGEHAQSVVLASALPILLARRLPAFLETSAYVAAAYVALQLFSFGVALIPPILASQSPSPTLQSLSLSLFLLMFLLLREAGLSLLWRLALVDANESIDARDALTTPTLQTLRRI